MKKFHPSMNKAGTVMLLVTLGFAGIARACIWDARTLYQEKHEHPTLAEAILHPKTEQSDVKSLTGDIAKLKTTPSTNDPMWWNNLAGAYLRLGQPEEAVKILEPLTNRFANDYGIHANLGTAYHLLGRYVEAEREIRRDTEINTNAHFGLEKYHLALLQYLSRDENYRNRHIYVEEFTKSFLDGGWGHIEPHSGMPERQSSHEDEAELKQMEVDTQKRLQQPSAAFDWSDCTELMALATVDEPPAYMAKWDLGTDSKLEDGVVYMATLNPKEPACWTMMGLLALHHHEYHLAKVAFEKAIQLGSPQAPILRMLLSQRIQRQLDNKNPIPIILLCAGSLIALVIGYYLFCKWREFKVRRPKKAAA